MKFDEQDVERVAEAMFLAGNPLAGPDDMDDADRTYYGGLARAALAAMEREPLDGNVEHIHAAADEVEAYLSMAADEEETLEVVMGREKYSIASAALRGVDNIRNAVVAAKGGE